MIWSVVLNIVGYLPLPTAIKYPLVASIAEIPYCWFTAIQSSIFIGKKHDKRYFLALKKCKSKLKLSGWKRDPFIASRKSITTSEPLIVSVDNYWFEQCRTVFIEAVVEGDKMYEWGRLVECVFPLLRPIRFTVSDFMEYKYFVWQNSLKHLEDM